MIAVITVTILIVIVIAVSIVGAIIKLYYYKWRKNVQNRNAADEEQDLVDGGDNAPNNPLDDKEEFVHIDPPKIDEAPD